MNLGAQGRRLLRYLPVLALGRPLHGRERYRPFFIVGSGRCGTTLLRAMLQTHPAVHIPPETHMLRAAIRDYRRYSRLPWHVVLRIVLGHFTFHRWWELFELDLAPVFHELVQLPRERRHLAAVLNTLYRAHATRHKPAATCWGDKTPHHVQILNVLRRTFPDLMVVHLVRDGRDVAHSFNRLATVMRAPGMTLHDAAALWLGAVRAGRAFAARYPSQYLEIRYEDLVSEPRRPLEAVTAFLDLPFEDTMLRHHEFDLTLRDVERYTQLQGVREPLYQTAIGRWRTELDNGQIAELERLLGPTLAAVGYGNPGAVTEATPRDRD